MNEILKAALSYVDAGLSILPAGKDKRPTVTEWTSFMKQIPSHDKVKVLFSKNSTNIAAVGGKVSGNLEILDFDFMAEALATWVSNVQEQDPNLFAKLVFERSPRGSHVIYRADAVIPGNMKLARKAVEVNGPGEHEYKSKILKAQQVNGKWIIVFELIETRGEGGYCLVYPSKGYDIKQGDFRKVPTITAAERGILIEAARACNEFHPPQDINRGYSGNHQGGKLPGQDYDERGDLRALLEKHDWTSKGLANDGRERWARPGKDKGHSATLTDGKIFYVFSANAHPFESGRTYGPFAVYAILEHKWDFSAASKALAAQGYGSRPKQEKGKARLRSLDELKSKFSGHVSYLWRQHIPKGMPVMINGREGVGKSKNGLAIARDILNENPNGVIVWVASEGFVSDTITKAYEVGLPMDGRFHIAEKPDETYRFDFRWEDDRRMLAEVLEGVKDRLLCVFIDSIRGMTGGDDMDPKTGSVMHKVNSIVCDRFKATLVYLDHWKKGKADNLLDKAVGTTAKTAAVRLVLSIVPSSTYTRKIKMAKSNISPSMPDLRSVEVGSNIIIEQETDEAEEALYTKAEHWLIGFMTKNDEGYASDIYAEGEELGYSDKLLRKLKSKLGIGHKKVDGKSVWVSPYRKEAQLAQLILGDSEKEEESDTYEETSAAPIYCASTALSPTAPTVLTAPSALSKKTRSSREKNSDDKGLDTIHQNSIKAPDFEAITEEDLEHGIEI